MDSAKECVPNVNFDKCAVVLLDVAGTTTSTTFVKETLFAFAVDQAPTYLKDHWDDEETKEAVKLLQDGDTVLDVDGAVQRFKKLTDENSDNKGLKTLQGIIYKKGYEDGTLKAHVFPDVAKALESWSPDRKVAIYSTGSVDSQKLLFTHTTEGNLTAKISQYFDQSVGVKTESTSYTKIAEELKAKAEEILFISDSIDELKAAKEAGLFTALVTREGNTDHSEEASKEFTVISSFAEVSFECSNKRKNEEDVTEAPPTKIAKTEEEKDEKPATTEASSAKPEIEEQPVKNGEPPVEAMEVDAAEPENTVTPNTDECKSNSTEITTDGASSVPEAMDTAQVKTDASTETKAAEEPEKTDVKTSTDQVDKEKGKCNEELTPTENKNVETESKTEISDSNKDVEVACSTEKNGETTVAVEILEKSTKNEEVKDVELAEEAVEVTKENAQNDKCDNDNMEVAQEAIETDVKEAKVEEKKNVTEEKQNVDEGKQKVNEGEQKVNEEKQNVNEEKQKTNEEKQNVNDEKQNMTDEKQNVTDEKQNVTDKKPNVTDEKQNVTDEKQNATDEKQTAIDEKQTATEEKQNVTEEKQNIKDDKHVEEKKVEEKECEAKETVKPVKDQVIEENSTSEVKVSTKEEKLHENTDHSVAEETKKETETDKCSKKGTSVVEEKKTEATAQEETSVKANAEENTAVVDNTEKEIVNEVKDIVEEPVKIQENGKETEKQNGNASCEPDSKDVTNGDVNGQENGNKEKTTKTDPEEETDIKIKKVETNVGSPAVSVEV